MLTRYWIEFETNQYEDFTFNCFFKRGIGVTAYNYDDAIKLLEKNISYFEEGVQGIKSVTENIDINDLDRGHVIPNMGICSNRGIWYPQGFDFYK